MVVTAGARMAHALLERLEAEGKLDRDLRYEILDGELVIRGAPAVQHGEVVNLLGRHFGSWAVQHGGKALVGVAIEVGDEQLVPDLSFIGPDRVGELDADGFHVPPDLVAEVTSPGTRSLDLFKKRNLYAKIGVPEYWVVDLGEGRAVAHRREGAGVYDVVEHTGGALRTEQAPGLEIPLAELFGDG